MSPTPVSSSRTVSIAASLVTSSTPSSASQNPGKVAWQTAVCLIVAFGVLTALASVIFWRAWIVGRSSPNARTSKLSSANAHPSFTDVNSAPGPKTHHAQDRCPIWQRWTHSVAPLRRVLDGKLRRAQVFQRLPNSTQSLVRAPMAPIPGKVVPQTRQHVVRPIACVPRDAALRGGANPWSVYAPEEPSGTVARTV